MTSRKTNMTDLTLCDQPADEIIRFALIKTTRRLTLDIEFQLESTRFRGEDDGDFYTFVATNGVEVISRSRMDIQTERLWLLGASDDTRSGSMVFSSNEKRDRAYEEFMAAMTEWVDHVRSGAWGYRAESRAAAAAAAVLAGLDLDSAPDDAARAEVLDALLTYGRRRGNDQLIAACLTAMR